MITLTNNLSESPLFGAEASGDFKVEILETISNKDGDFLKLEIIGLTENSFPYRISVEDAGGNAEAPDPGDVFRTLMELLKRTICPECL